MNPVNVLSDEITRYTRNVTQVTELKNLYQQQVNVANVQQRFSAIAANAITLANNFQEALLPLNIPRGGE